MTDVHRGEFHAMGCAVHVVVTGGSDALVERARRRIDDLEARWSRFRVDSEISILSASPGTPVVVSAETFTLVERAVESWRLTGGRFDPTVARAVAAAGYDRSFELIDGSAVASETAPAHGCDRIELDPVVGAVTLPPGVGFDPGGIGKGLAGDFAVEELLRGGAAGALVEIGGDVRVAGEPPGEGGWTIAIEDPFDDSPPPDDPWTHGWGAELLAVSLADGAVATSSRRRRAWATPDGRRHHLIDPATGAPAEGDVVAVTVVAGAGWWAEVLAKAVFLAGPVEGLRLLAGRGATGLVVDARGVRYEADDLEELVA